MTDVQNGTADVLRTDALRLADSLDGMETRDWVERIGSAVKYGEVKYAELLHRRESLSMNAVDAASIDSILGTIRARLAFLESLHRRNAEG